ncbi:MAG: hypothetical protein CMJ94_14375 [Planctomycetes bacterium]|nr:hypothetical protein [Planctomycetota bacterium]
MRQILTKRSLLPLALLGAAAALFVLPPRAAAEAESLAAPAPRPVPVRALRPEAVEGRLEVQRYTGTIQARRESELGFERAGKIARLQVDLGSQVDQGQVLAELDLAPLQLEREAAVASLARARAQRDEAVAGPRVEQIEIARQELRRIDAELERIQREAARRQELLAEGVSAPEEAETLAFAAQAMEAQREAAAQGLQELEKGTRPEQLAAVEAALALAEARLAQIDLELERSVLRAPYAGTILARFADEGEVLAAGTPLVTLQESAALEARMGVPDALADQVEPGEQVELQSPRGTLAAVVRAALPQIDPATRSRTLILDLDAGAGLAGSTVAWQTQRFRPGQGHRIPATALVSSRRGLWSVYLVEGPVEDARIRRQEVEVLHAGSDEVIVAGLRDADRVLAGGTERVVPGQTVAIQED